MRSHVAAIGCTALVMFVMACSRHAPAERATELRSGAHPSSSSPPASSSSMVAASTGDTHAAPPSGTTGDAGGTAPLAPLDGFPAELELLDGKEKLGIVSVPLGAREPRPIMVAIHGGSDRPEIACPAWRGITEAYPFVVCPRGFGGNERRLGWRNTADTSARIARAVAATKKTFGTWVKATDSLVLGGFSMGGSQVALLASAEPKTYRRIAVGDSAHDPQPALRFAHAWVAGGGDRAIFLCTTSGCEPALRAAARKVGSEKGASARLNISPTRVHALSERAVQSMRRDWPWLVEGAEGWEAYVPPSDPSSLPGKTELFGPK